MLVLDDRRAAATGAPATQDLPPPLDLELTDADRHIGRIRGTTIRFRGFSDDVEAAHAAWVAWRAVKRRLAKLAGERPIPIDVAPLTIVRASDAWKVMAGGEYVATLVLPSDAGDPDEGTVAFEIEAPAGTGELMMRSLARLAYRTLRKSGLRWGIMMSARASRTLPSPASSETPAAVAPPTSPAVARAANPFVKLGGSIVAVILLLALGLRFLAGRPSTIYVPGMIGIAIAGTAIVLWGAWDLLDGAPPAGEHVRS